MTYLFRTLLFLLFTVWLVGCVPTREPQPIRYTPSTDLRVPSPAKLSNYIYGLVDCRDAVGLLKANIVEAEGWLERSLQEVSFSDVNCYTLSSFKMDIFYKDMAQVITDADYELRDELFISPTGTRISIEFWEGEAKTKVLVYSGSGDFVVMDIVE